MLILQRIKSDAHWFQTEGDLAGCIFEARIPQEVWCSQVPNLDLMAGLAGRFSIKLTNGASPGKKTNCALFGGPGASDNDENYCSTSFKRWISTEEYHNHQYEGTIKELVDQLWLAALQEWATQFIFIQYDSNWTLCSGGRENNDKPKPRGLSTHGELQMANRLFFKQRFLAKVVPVGNGVWSSSGMPMASTSPSSMLSSLATWYRSK